MTRFLSITPNLLVKDINRSVAFYRDVLGFQTGETVPDREPFVFVWMKRDEVSVFLNDPSAVAEDLPAVQGRQPGGTNTMFFIISDVDGYHADVAPKATVVMPLKTQFYGMREFAVTDPDGHLITFAERVAAAGDPDAS
ncbi:MAG TPA: VOC family protein [Vicinamibacterales bacterium]|nr:VOC family protein [Vicinamibacterales bacterium]